MKMSERIAELVKQHGSFRKAGRALEIEPAYLHRLYSGVKEDPGADILRKLGLRRVVNYIRRGDSQS